jgi:hypothetical protein
VLQRRNHERKSSNDSNDSEPKDDGTKTEVDPAEHVDDETFGKVYGNRFPNDGFHRQAGDEANDFDLMDTQPDARAYPIIRNSAESDEISTPNQQILSR